MKYLLCLIFFSVGCGSDGTYRLPYQSTVELCSQAIGDPSKPTIYGYGDSTMAGNLVGCENSYIDLVASQLNYNVLNKGSAGSGMFGQNQYYSMMSDVWPAGSIVVFVPGINDISFEHQAPNTPELYQPQYVQALQNILNRVSTMNIQVYIGTPLPPNPDFQVDYEEDIKVFAYINRSLVQQINMPNIHLIDLNTWYQPTSSNDLDWIHPNNYGNQLIAGYIYNLLD